MKFLRNFLASLMALVVFSFFGFIFMMALVAALEDADTYTVKENTVLKIDLSATLADRDFDDPLSNFGMVKGVEKRIGIIDIRKALEHAATDEKIKGVVLQAPGLMGGFSLGQELRGVLREFKQSGKFIWVYADMMSEGGFYLASVADKIYLNPVGALEWNGLVIETMFFKGTFEKLEIEPQIFRVGEFKSAVEPFMLDKMSDANRLQVRSLINSIYSTMLDEMAVDLGIPAEKLREMSDKMTVQTVQDAVDQGLITGAVYRDEFEAMLAEEIGVEEAGDIHYASYSQYNSSFSNYVKSKNKIAVIIAEGEIMMGDKERGLITPEQFTKELRKAREDDKVKAVVFRINSPGGDALASDIIWREVVKTAEVKPVIASMSTYAASGGYYLAMAADTIVAEPTTLTGSIGIFGMVFNIGDFMKNKLGITTDSEATGELSGLMTSSRALTDTEKTIIQNSVNRGYEIFTSKAAAGRNMDIDELKAIASGRVWTGVQAKENGLVDLLGGLDMAIEVAAAKAGIEGDYKVRYYPAKKSAIEEIMEEFSKTSQAKAMRAKLGDLYPYVDLLEKVERMQGIQARMPFEVEIR